MGGRREVPSKTITHGGGNKWQPVAGGGCQLRWWLGLVIVIVVFFLREGDEEE